MGCGMSQEWDVRGVRNGRRDVSGMGRWDETAWVIDSASIGPKETTERRLG